MSTDLNKLIKAFAKIKKAEDAIAALMTARGIPDARVIIHRTESGPPDCTLYSSASVFHSTQKQRIGGRITRRLDRITVPYGRDVSTAIFLATKWSA